MVKRKFETKKAVYEHYEKTAKTYDVARSTSYEGKIVDKLQREILFRILTKNNCRKVFEAGCGTGRILLYLAKKGFDCYGLDPSKNMIAEFRKKLEKTNIKIKLNIGDIENMPYNDNSFDCVYTLHVLMHLPDYKKAFKEMYRVTKKNGVIVCDFPNLESPWTKLSLLLNPKKERTGLFKIDELKKFFRQYNYQITGLFSYARTFYKIPLIKHIVFFLEKNFQLPLKWRTQLFVIVKK
jgi:ubiquinone/menaquinone biosynthesis C-methylase UbiE